MPLNLASRSEESKRYLSILMLPLIRKAYFFNAYTFLKGEFKTTKVVTLGLPLDQATFDVCCDSLFIQTEQTQAFTLFFHVSSNRAKCPLWPTVSGVLSTNISFPLLPTFWNKAVHQQAWRPSWCLVLHLSRLLLWLAFLFTEHAVKGVLCIAVEGVLLKKSCEQK